MDPRTFRVWELARSLGYAISFHHASRAAEQLAEGDPLDRDNVDAVLKGLGCIRHEELHRGEDGGEP